MRKVALIGTSHEHHGARWEGPTPPSQAEFADMLSAVLECRPDCIVFEEADADWGQGTVPSRVAAALHHPYFPVDLTPKQRQEQGLWTVQHDVETTVLINVAEGHDELEVRQHLARAREVRETAWVECIETSLGENDEGVLILGANHVESVAAKLHSRGVQVDTLHNCWEPTTKAV